MPGAYERHEIDVSHRGHRHGFEAARCADQGIDQGRQGEQDGKGAEPGCPGGKSPVDSKGGKGDRFFQYRSQVAGVSPFQSPGQGRLNGASHRQVNHLNQIPAGVCQRPKDAVGIGRERGREKGACPGPAGGEVGGKDPCLGKQKKQRQGDQPSSPDALQGFYAIAPTVPAR